MDPLFEDKLAKYADTVVRVAINLQPNQRFLIGAPFMGMDGTPLDTYPLVRAMAKSAYLAGARYVGVNWDDEELQRIRVQYAASDAMDEFAFWKNDVALDYIRNGDAFLRIYAPNPGLLDGLDAHRLQSKRLTEAQYYTPIRTKLGTGAANYTIISAATPGWASMVYPGLNIDDAVVQLWETIFEVCRINQPDPVAAWAQHMTDLGKRVDYLNGKSYTALKYTTAETDLTVGLPDGHIWHSAAMRHQNGTSFVVNFPTEEVYTLPHRDQIDGVVSSTRPLSFGGSMIDGMVLRFSGGKVVEAQADVGQSTLDSILKTDDGARSLGEVALVPDGSPISQSNVLFYNTLFDENASNHLALGNAYRVTMHEGDVMSREEFAAKGGNESMTHVDFMIGSAAMDVDGVLANGSIEPVMRGGEWAFEI